MTPHPLSDADLRALDDLERRVVEADGGRLKLEKRALREGAGAGLLSWDGDRLVGYLGLYTFGEPVELAGAVDPAHRRRGIGSALLDAALRACTAPPLLVVPAGSAPGTALAQARGGTLHHREHALVLTVPPEGPEDPRTTVRPAVEADTDVVERVLAAAFGFAPRGIGADTRVVEVDGEPVGTLRVHHEGATAGVYGFAVDPARQGQGTGRDVLRRVCRQALAEGAERVALEVAVDNPGALHLYTSTGFAPVAGEDYWELPLP